jgi:hypothetical protein
MKRLLPILMVFGVFLGSAEEGWSGDFWKGLDAYNKKDYAAALSEWNPLAEQGNISAQFNLGVMYAEGKGVPKDDTTSVKWFTRAAEQGNAFAQVNLGFMYQYGKGTTKNEEKAVRWYRLAAGQGNADAQVHLGLMYRSKSIPPHRFFFVLCSSFSILVHKTQINLGKSISLFGGTCEPLH